MMPLLTGRRWDAELSSFEGRDLDQWLRQATWRPGPRHGRYPRIFRSVDGRGFPSAWTGLSADCVPFCSVAVTDSLKAGAAVRGACGISFIRSRTLLVTRPWLRRLYQSVTQQTAPSLPASSQFALCKMATEWWFSVARFKERNDTEWIAVHVKYSQLLSVGDWCQRQGFM